MSIEVPIAFEEEGLDLWVLVNLCLAGAFYRTLINISRRWSAVPTLAKNVRIDGNGWAKNGDFGSDIRTVQLHMYTWGLIDRRLDPLRIIDQGWAREGRLLPKEFLQVALIYM
jgi:hypothetical protein